jgi:hypothetical protein
MDVETAVRDLVDALRSELTPTSPAPQSDRLLPHQFLPLSMTVPWGRGSALGAPSGRPCEFRRSERTIPDRSSHIGRAMVGIVRGEGAGQGRGAKFAHTIKAPVDRRGAANIARPGLGP